MARKRIIIQADTETDAALFEHLSEKGFSKEGRRMLRAALVLHEANLIDKLMFVSESSDSSDLDALERLQLAIDLTDLVRKKTGVRKPRPGDLVTMDFDSPAPKKPRSDPFSMSTYNENYEMNDDDT